jgi:tetratricopeptide (TPR) repeat protein
VLDALVERADGVPLFLEELARAVLEEALDGVAPAAIPSTLQDSLMARLDRLGPAREVAQIASVLGREFDYALLRDVSGLPEEKLDLALVALADAELLYTRGLAPASTYLFRHTLMQDAAYQSLLKSRRRELHRAAAEALAARGAGEGQELLARHWEAAGEVERAVGEWKRAGDRARHRYALAEAERQYAHAIELLAALPETSERLEQELALQIPLAVVLGVTRSYGSPEHEASTSRAQQIFARLGGAKGHAMSLLSDAAGKIARGDLHATREAAERLLEAGLREGSRSALTWGHYLAGMVALNFADLARALAHGEQAAAAYREEDYAGTTIRPGTMVYDHLARVLAALGYVARAEAAAARAVEIAERTDSPPDCFAGWVQVAYTYAYLRDARSAARCIERAYALELAARPPFWVPLAELYRAWARAAEGDPSPDLQGAAIDAHRALSASPRVSFGGALPLLVELQMRLGRFDEALEATGHCLEAGRGNRIERPELLRLRAELRAAGGAEPALVEADLREAVALAHEMGARLLELRAATSLARELAKRGRGAEARELLAPLYGAFTEGFAARDLVEARAVLDPFGSEGP